MFFEGRRAGRAATRTTAAQKIRGTTCCLPVQGKMCFFRPLGGPLPSTARARAWSGPVKTSLATKKKSPQRHAMSRHATQIQPKPASRHAPPVSPVVKGYDACTARGELSLGGRIPCSSHADFGVDIDTAVQRFLFLVVFVQRPFRKLDWAHF